VVKVGSTLVLPVSVISKFRPGGVAERSKEIESQFTDFYLKVYS